jgi:hypothetical protein
LASKNLKRRLILKKIVKIRYFKSINPFRYPIISVSQSITETDMGDYNVSATVFVDELVFAQLNVSLQSLRKHLRSLILF